MNRPRKPGSNWPRQNFILPSELKQHISREEVDATYAAMTEAGVAQPPFPDFDISMTADMMFHLKTDDPEQAAQSQAEMAKTALKFRYQGERTDCLISNSHGDPLRSIFDFIDADGQEETQLNVIDAIEAMRRLLVVLLATRNVVKTTTESKAAALGIGKRRYRFTTVLTVGQITESETTGSGLPKRPHLRRGHIRHQHHGPGNKQTKLIFIEAVFVNSDREWVADRDSYVMRGPRAP